MKDKILNLMTEDYTNDEMKVIIDKIAKHITDNVISNLLQTEYKQISYNYIDGVFEITEIGKKLLIERARLVAGAKNKVNLLKELI